MAQEIGYQRQVAPRAATPLPRPTPEQFGAGFGRALEQVGEQLHRQGIERYQVQRQQTADEERARFLKGFAAHQENAAAMAREARKDGSTGHAERMGQAWEAAREALVDGISEDKVRLWASNLFDESGARFRDGEASFEAVESGRRVVENFSTYRDTRANAVRRLEKPDEYAAAQAEAAEAIAALDVSQAVKDKLHRETSQTYAIAFLQGQIERDPAVAKALVGSGAFDDVLEPQQVEALLNRTDVEIRAQAVEARRAAAETEAQLREQIQVLEELDRQGVELPPEKYAEAVKAAVVLGDTSLALKVEGLGRNSDFAKVWGVATPMQREARLAELAGKDKRTVDEDRELQWLRDKSGALDSKFNSDPAGFAARAGEAMPPLEDVAGRASWARARSAAYGRPVPPITANEAKQLQANFRSDRASQVEVLDFLGAFPADQAAAAARMVDPNDATLAVMVTLPERYRTLALDGRDALKANPRLFKDAFKDDPRLKEQVDAHDARFAQALRNVPPAQRQAVLAVAGRIMAGSIDQSGGELTEGLYFKALNMALGSSGTGTDRKGGLGKWGDNWFLLPDGVTGGGFGAAVRQAAAGEGGPVNPDGSPATIARAFPVAVGAGLYEFHMPGGAVLKTAEGAPWRVRVRAK